MMTMTDEKVKRLPVRFKTALGEKRTLFSPYEVGKPSACTHRNFLVDERSAVVECGQCGEKLNPMWVLQQLARDDARFHQAARQYQDEMRRLSERSSTKCRHCGRMTSISRR